MGKTITTQTIAKAKEMKLAGKTIAEIASELDVNPHTIQYHLRNTKVKPQKKLTDEQKEQILALSREGLSTYKIADKLDLPQSTVYACIKKEKEPATAGTVTDSQKTDVIVEDNTVSVSKNTTGDAKSQAMLKRIQKEFLGIYERLDESHQHAWDLGELHAQIKEAIGNADT